jgi:hypothetical protein
MQDKRPTPVPISPERLSVYARTMLAAADTLGGITALAEFLKAPRDELIGWMSGIKRPPEKSFLAAIDVVLDEHELLRKTFHPEKGSKALLRAGPKP